MRGFLRDQFPHFGMVPATVTGYEAASLWSAAGEGPEPSRWHFLYNDLAFLGGDGHPFLVVPSPAVLDFGDLRGTGISNAVLPYSA